MDIRIYRTRSGQEPYSTWLRSLKDKTSRVRILQRIERLSLGHFGDCKSVGSGVYEMRFFFGSGYRVYYARQGTEIILLLCGGDKSSQKNDIEKAKAYWKDYKEHYT